VEKTHLVVFESLKNLNVALGVAWYIGFFAASPAIV
jgi:hypothetical protein